MSLTLSRKRRAESYLFVARADKDVDVTISADATVENGQVFLRNFESSIELSAEETDEGKAKLVDVVLCY